MPLDTMSKASKKPVRRRKKGMDYFEIKAIERKSFYLSEMLRNDASCQSAFEAAGNLCGITPENLKNCGEEEGAKLIAQTLCRESSFSRVLTLLDSIHVSLGDGVRAQYSVLRPGFRAEEKQEDESKRLVRRLYPGTERFSDAQKAILQRLVAGKLQSTKVVGEKAYERFKEKLEDYQERNAQVDGMLIACRKRLLEFLEQEDGPVQVWGENLVSTTEALQNAQKPLIEHFQSVVEHMIQFAERAIFLKQCALDEVERVRDLLHIESDFSGTVDAMVALRWHELQQQYVVVETSIRRYMREAQEHRLRLVLLSWRGVLQFGSRREGVLVHEAQETQDTAVHLEQVASRLRRSLYISRLLLRSYQIKYERLRRSPLLHYLSEREERGRAIKACMKASENTYLSN